MLVSSAALAACVDKTDADYRAEVTTAVRESVATDLDTLVKFARDLQAASPSRSWVTPFGGVNRMAISNMRDAWRKTRVAFEHIEGAIEPMFDDLDFALDARYEESLAKLNGAGDQSLFDANGVTGMHAIERILFAPDIRPDVVNFESQLPGYKPAAYPASDNDAIAFKFGLVQRLIDDADNLRKRWQVADDIDVGLAFRGLISLMIEQQQKVNLAVSNAEESRYSNITLFDLRNNLDGTKTIYGLFRDWARSKSAGIPPDDLIQAKFTDLVMAYSTDPGDALPTVPASWRNLGPTADNLATPFGTMWMSIRQAVDPDSDASAVFSMNKIATLLAFPESLP